MKDFITIIHSKCRRLAKLIHADGRVDSYDQARIIDASMVAVSDIDGLFFRLDALCGRPDLATVRGRLIGGSRVHNVRRLIRERDTEPDGAAILEETEHHWIALDIDGIHRPDDVPAEDLLGCARSAIDLLPGEFRTARCIIVATAGHGLKPGSRLRLWFWASRPLTGRELSRWMRRSPVDLRIFLPNQICYTAAPLFAEGAVDHLPYRMADRPGTECVEAPSIEALAPPEPPKYTPPKTKASSDQRATRMMTNALARVETAIQHDRHNQLCRAAFTIGGLLDTAGISEAAAEAALMGAISRATGDDANPTKDRNTIQTGLAAGRERPLLTGASNG